MRKLVPTALAAVVLLTLTGCAGTTEDAETTPVGFAAPAATGTPSQAPTEPVEATPVSVVTPTLTPQESEWLGYRISDPASWEPLGLTDEEFIALGYRLCDTVNPDGSDLFEVKMYPDAPQEWYSLNDTIARGASMLFCPEVHENYLALDHWR